MQRIRRYTKPNLIFSGRDSLTEQPCNNLTYANYLVLRIAVKINDLTKRLTKNYYNLVRKKKNRKNKYAKLYKKPKKKPETIRKST